MVQLVPLQESNALTIANKVLNYMVSQHGLLECITNDCDPGFCGHFWDELMFLLDTMLMFTMALHHQTDSIFEAINHTME